MILKVFEPLPDPEAWSQFQSRYGRRVRALRHEFSSLVDYTSLLEAMTQVNSSPLPLFPNLHTLRWNASMTHEFHAVIPLLHSGMRHCSFTSRYHDQYGPGVPRLMRALQSCTPSLVFLEMNFFPEPQLLEPMAKLIGSLGSLVHIRIPGFRDSSQILSSIKRPSAVKSLEFLSYSSTKDGSLTFRSFHLGAHDMFVNHTGPGNVFPNLEYLNASVRDLAALHPFFQGSTSLQHLRAVRISSNIHDMATKLSILDFLHTLVQSCPAVVKIRLEVGHAMDPLHDAITLQDLQVLLHYTQIKVFQLRTPYVLSLSDGDFQQIGLAWPQLEEFDLLHHRFLYSRDKTLSLWAIFVLTRLCPNLRHVRLPFNTRAFETPMFDPASLPHRFRIPGVKIAQLDSLQIGEGVFLSGDESMLPAMLAQLCGPRCKVGFQLSHFLPLAQTHFPDINWSNVLKKVPRFSQLHSTIRQYEGRVIALKQEIVNNDTDSVTHDLPMIALLIMFTFQLLYCQFLVWYWQHEPSAIQICSRVLPSWVARRFRLRNKYVY